LRKEREMTTRKKTPSGKTKFKILDLKKETIKDLTAKTSDKIIKGGRREQPTYPGGTDPLCPQ
jgi:hypothetical protein